MDRHRAALPSVLIALLVAAALAGCAAPTPTETSPAERFVDRLRDPAFDLVAGIKGRYALTADQVFPVWGALAVDGPDARLVTAMEGPLGVEAWEQILRGGAVTERPGSRQWAEPVPVADTSAAFRIALAGIESMGQLGTEVVDGRSLEHLRGDLAIGPEAFGLAGSGVGSATLDAWVDEAGSPVRMHIETGSLTVELDPLRLDVAAPIAAPYKLAVLQAPNLKYALVHPADWRVQDRGSGHLIGLDGAYVITYCSAAGGLDLASWVAEGNDFYTGLWGSEPEASEDVVVATGSGSAPATLSTWHGIAEGEAAYILDLAVIADGVACDVQWFSPPGDESADRARFEQLLAGFRLGG